MVYYSMKTYKLGEISKSNRKNKKYKIQVIDKKTGKIEYIHFGSSIHQQYRDTTPLKLYSHLDHNDKERRARYRKRHEHTIRKGYISSGYMSWIYLWNFDY